MKEADLFAKALDLPPEERTAFLREACGSDDALRQNVEELLNEHDNDSGLLDQSLPKLDDSLPASSDHELPASTISERAGGEKILYFGDYELHEEIARGAMGVVYRAEQTSLKRTVAIKMIRSTLLVNDADIARFRTEAESAASLDHPNIVPIYEIGEHEEQHYFSMKLIEGGTLRDHLEKLHHDPKAAARLIATVAEAIHSAHQRGILHRDLKPGNILIDENGDPHVTDFGLAKQMDNVSSATLSGQIMGTPSYMAPEQAEGGGKALTTAADIYALGAIFYEILTGRPPHKGASLITTLKLVATAEPDAPRAIDSHIDRDLETITMKCLERDPTQRYPSAQDLADELERWLRGEPIEARPVGTAEKVFKWIKRKPAQASALAIAMLFLLTLGIGGPIAALHQAELRHEATLALGKAQIALAEAAYRAKSIDQVDRYLAACPEEARDTHWRYLNRYVDESLYRIEQPLNGWTNGLSSVPGSSDRYLALGITGDLALMDGRGKVLDRIDTQTSGAAMTMFPDGSSIALTRGRFENTNEVEIYSINPLKKIARWPLPKPGKILVSFFTPDSKHLVLGTEENTLLIDPRAGLHKSIPDFTAACAHPLKNLWFGLRDHRLGSYDPTTGEFSKFSTTYQNPCIMAVSPDGETLANNPHGGTVQLYRTNNASLIKMFTAHDANCSWIRFSRNGNELLSFGTDGGGANSHAFRAWSTNPKNLDLLRSIVVRDPEWETGPRIAWIEDEDFLLASRNDLQAFRTPSFSYDQTIQHTIDPVFLDETRIAFSQVGTFATWRKTLGVWNTQTAQIEAIYGGFNAVIRTKDRATVLSANHGGGVEKPRVAPKIIGGTSEAGIMLPSYVDTELAASSDGQHLAGADLEKFGVIRISGSKSTEVFSRSYEETSDQEEILNPRFFFLDGAEPHLLVSFTARSPSAGRSVYQLYNYTTSELLLSRSDPVITTCMIQGPQSGLIMAGSADGTVRGIDTSTLETRFVTRVHDAGVSALAMRPDGEILATGDNKGLIRLWSIADDGPVTVLRELLGRPNSIDSLDFSPSGKRLVAEAGWNIVIFGMDENNPLIPDGAIPGDDSDQERKLHQVILSDDGKISPPKRIRLRPMRR